MTELSEVMLKPATDNLASGRATSVKLVGKNVFSAMTVLLAEHNNSNTTEGQKVNTLLS